MKKLFLTCTLLVALCVAMFAQVGQAKYVFYFIGDGMGINQVNGAEMYLGDQQGKKSPVPLTFTQFPYVGLSMTYSQSNPITDSAAGGTALAVGEKTSNGTLGMDHTHTKSFESVAERAKKAGYAVGIATSVSIDHATPASFYAHRPSRKMAYEIGTDLAKSGFDFFAGSDFVSPDNKKDKKATNLYKLVQDSGYVIVRGFDEYNKRGVEAGKVILFQEEGKDVNSIPFAIDRGADDLSLTQITEAAIDFLSKSDKGFFVMIEGGKIDWSSHSNDGATTFEEVIDMDNAVKKAYDFYLQHPDSTLIVITADHETGGLALGIGGYALDFGQFKNQKRSQAELSKSIIALLKSNKGKVTWEQMRDLLKDELGFWNTVEITEQEEQILMAEYNKMMGIGTIKSKSEYFEDEEIAAVAIQILNKTAKAGWTTNSHSGAYVPVFAIGAGADQFTGLQENTDIPKKIIKAAGY